jgi:hypothetical protein
LPVRERQADRKWLIGGAGIGVAVLIVLVVAWQIKSIDIPLLSEGHSVAQADSGSSHPVAESEGSDLQRCVNVWNGSSNAGPRSELVALVPEYISITMSSIYEDKCLVTAANSELNLASQFLEGDTTSGATYSATESGTATTLPASVTQWNASANSEGYLSLNP